MLLENAWHVVVKLEFLLETIRLTTKVYKITGKDH